MRTCTKTEEDHNNSTKRDLLSLVESLHDSLFNRWMLDDWRTQQQPNGKGHVSQLCLARSYQESGPQCVHEFPRGLAGKSISRVSPGLYLFRGFATGPGACFQTRREDSERLSPCEAASVLLRCPRGGFAEPQEPNEVAAQSLGWDLNYRSEPQNVFQLHNLAVRILGRREEDHATRR